MHHTTTTRCVGVGLIVALVSAVSARAFAEARVDRPMALAWPASRAWDDGAERQFGEFVATLGRAIRHHRCRTLAGCLNDERVNPLFETEAPPLRFTSDCADVPYTLRAYFAYRRRLPFAWARSMRGNGHDPRYFMNARPTGLHMWTEFATPRALLQSIGTEVHSGFLRTAPDVESADFYQAALAPGAIRPGSVYYDPNGHVLMVYEIRRDGEVLMFDGHVGNRITHSSFHRRHILGSAALGGGFKNFRPIALHDGRIVQAPNASLRDFGGRSPFDRALYQVDGRSVPFEIYVRWRLSNATLL